MVDHARGPAKRKRLERLLTEAREYSRKEPLSELRRDLKRKLQPDEATFRRYHERFLMSDAPENRGRFTVTLDDVIAALGSK